MANNYKELLKKAVEIYSGNSTNGDENLFPLDQNLLSKRISFFKEAVKAEDLNKSESGSALLALVLYKIKNIYKSGEEIVNQFLSTNGVSTEEENEIRRYISFLDSDRDEESKIEEVLRDAQYLHLGMPDALEKLELQRKREAKVDGIVYSESEWTDKCKEQFIKHGFNCAYTIQNFGVTRGKNFIELEKRADKLKIATKEKNANFKNTQLDLISDKEGEDLFKLAFRNSVNLISVADRKAGMLIQINTLLAGFVFTLGVAKFEENPYYLIPTAAILIGSALTVFFGILASRPVKRDTSDDIGYDKIGFFFGSYDRLDTAARKVSWEKYSSDMSDLLEGNKKFVFNGLIRESYEVSKVLSRKFGYLSLAYKIFFAGLFLGIVGFLVLIIYEYNTIAPHAAGMNNAAPF